MKRNKRTAPIWAKNLAKKFEIEKNAKNTAYYFILSHGYLDEFRRFIYQNRASDRHKECLSVIELMEKTKNKL